VKPLSPDQAVADKAITKWLESALTNNYEPQTFSLGGYAGTGKTTILEAIIQGLLYEGLKVACVSLTGKAVSVMQAKLPLGARYGTLHSTLYRPVIDERTGQIVDWIPRRMNHPDDTENDTSGLPFIDLFINDEASMTGEEIYNDLLAHHRPVLFVGDHGQLPPVGTDFNLMAKPDIRLEKIHRTAQDNPIIKVATRAREVGYLAKKKYSDTVQVIDQNDVPDSIAHLMLNADPETLIITATNNQRVAVNMSILERRGRDLNKQSLPLPGDRIICLKNSRPHGLFNGAQCTVEAIEQQQHMQTLMRIIPDHTGQAISIPVAHWAFNESKPQRPPGPMEPAIPFDYGYCLTCHKAQGSEAERVFVIGRGFGELDMRKRWLYTAVTRARNELYVLQ
jgi:exodeoxyribonuclease-5